MVYSFGCDSQRIANADPIGKLDWVLRILHDVELQPDDGQAVHTIAIHQLLMS
jgi:hypothetical protein